MSAQPEELQPLMMTGQIAGCEPWRGLRLESLKLAVELYAARPHDDFTGQAVTHAAGEFAKWLAEPAAKIHVGTPVISEQDNPAVHLPLHRGADMAIVMTDTQQATFPAAQEADSLGFPVTDPVAIAEDSGGTVVALTQNDDGTSVFKAVAPGTAQLSWTDGTLVFAESVNVTPGKAATIVVGDPVIEDIPASA